MKMKQVVFGLVVALGACFGQNASLTASLSKISKGSKVIRVQEDRKINLKPFEKHIERLYSAMKNEGKVDEFSRKFMAIYESMQNGKYEFSREEVQEIKRELVTHACSMNAYRKIPKEYREILKKGKE